MISPSQKLRQILSASGIKVLPGVYDCIGAKLAQQIGFEAVFTSGFGISASNFGLPDYGLITATEILTTTGRMAQSIEIPLMADLDTGYGNPLNVIRTVAEAIKQGIGGIILEDQVWPKKCGHFENKQVIPTYDHVQKIKAAIYARGESGLIIIARTDARGPLGLEEAIHRGKAYSEAGADIIFIEAPQSVEELETIALAFPNTYLLANSIQGGKTPILPPEQLEKLGYKIVVHPLSGLFAATQAMMKDLQYLKENGNTQNYPESLTFPEFKEIIQLPKYQDLERKFITEN